MRIRITINDKGCAFDIEGIEKSGYLFELKSLELDSGNA